MGNGPSASIGSGGPQLKGPRVLLVAPRSPSLETLCEHLAALPGSAADRIDDVSALTHALIDGSWDAVVFEHDPASLNADALLQAVVDCAGERPVVVVADEIGARAAAAALRAGAADFALRDDPDDVVAALTRCLSEDRQSRREVIEAATVTAVRATEEHFGSVFNEAPIGMAIISTAGVIVRVNRAMCEMSGYTNADLVGMDFQDMVHPEDVMLDHQQILDLLTGEIASYRTEKRYFHRNGAIRWINQSVSVARDGNGVPVYFIAQMLDTSAAREAEAALRAANARLQAIFDHAPVWLSLRGMDGRYLDANNELAQVLGTTKEELLGSYPGDFRQTPRVAQVAEDDRIVWETKQPITHEITVDHPTRGHRDYRVVRYPVLDEGGDVDAVGSFALDITDRRDADAERDRALTAFAEAQRLANVGSWTWDSVTDRSQWSDEMKRIFGLEIDAAPPGTNKFFSYIDHADRLAVAEGYRQVIAGGPMFETEYRINAADGARRVLRALGGADPDQPGAFIGTVQDVTELRAIERDVQAARERFRLAFEDAPVGMAISTLDGHLIQVNNSLCEITGYTRDELLSINIATITHPEELDDRTQLLEQLFSGEIDNYRRDGRLLRANGDAIWVSRHVRILRDAEGRAAQVLTHIVDITERRLMERELRHMADHDPLTGLLNRRGLEAELERHVAHVNRYGARGALLVLDLDHFKAVNDTLGHEAGDKLIVSVANLLRKRLRSSDAVARLGGDEFAILLPDANEEMAAHVAREIVSDVQRGAVVDHGQARRHVTASVGVTLFTQGAINAESVLVDADLAMYDAKEAGRDQIAIHTGGHDDQPRMKARLEWIERIRSALDHGQFTLYAQPIRELHSGQVDQCELLLRMVDDSGDTVPPGAFLYIAERYDLIHELDEWVAKEAIKLVEREQAEGRSGSVEINISGKSLANTRLLEVVESEIKRAQIDPSRLIFEVTETAAISHMALAREFAERLKGLGCRFALDDFGAGFGGFFYLKHIPFDFLKIDREFVTDCRTNRVDQLVIEALVSLARGLNKQTVAEGVEDHQTELFLRRHGVDLAQGYHIGRPAPILEGVPLWSK
jgi:diguanylate cyclase (GGDEF)-like protein/PAS domain S-box-containing protein